MNSEASAAPKSLPTRPPDTARGNLRKMGIALAKRVVPRQVIREIRRYRALKKSERSTYLKLRMVHELGLDSRRVPNNIRSVVFVCFGNIMRSPMSEALFRRELAGGGGKDMEVSSAGLNATPGKPAHPWAVTAAQELKISLADHKAKLLTPQMVEQVDAVIAMDLQNKLDFLSRYPMAADKFFLLGVYANGSRRAREIRDPFHGDLNETRACYRLIETCTRNLAESLAGRGVRNGTDPGQ